MAFAGEDAYTASGADQQRLSFDLHEDFAVKDVKELLCFLVVMANLGRARRHDFFDHAQLLMIDEVPGVAVCSPAIVLRVFAADDAGL